MSDESASNDHENVAWRFLETKVGQVVDAKLKAFEAMSGGSGGSTGDGMNAWQQAVESRLNNVQAELLDIRSEIRGLRSDMWSQFRWLIGITLGAFASPLGTMAKGFGWL